jgi:hypothetical protein
MIDNEFIKEHIVTESEAKSSENSLPRLKSGDRVLICNARGKWWFVDNSMEVAT